MYQVRRQRIKEYVQMKEIVSIRELQDLCPEVTLMTIHRDLDALQKTGVLVKIRGGARSAYYSGDPSFAVRERENLVAKEQIAAKALTLVGAGRSVFFDAGTTNLTLIRALPDIDLTIFTTGANFAQELARLARPSINICCGNLNRSNMAVSGHSTLDLLESVNIDLAFIGVSGYSPEAGLTCGKESEMLVKRLVISKARTSVALMDISKVGMLMPFTFAELADFDYLVTDGKLPDEIARLAAAGDTILL